jgi:hypothetical protein
MIPFNNNSSQTDKQEVLRNERKLREASTYFQMANAGVDLTLTGESSPAGYVAGSEPFVRYPAAAPGYSGGPQPGLEPPLGVEIDQQEPCGTPTEIERSLAPAVALASAPAGDALPPAPLHASSPGSVERGSVVRTPKEANVELKALLDRGLVRSAGSQVKRRRL